MDEAQKNWWADNLSVWAMEVALHKAMVKAGSNPEDVELFSWEDRTDPYADYTGVRVVTEDDDLRERAVRFLTTYISRRHTQARKLGVQLQGYPRGEDVVTLARYSLGD